MCVFRTTNELSKRQTDFSFTVCQEYSTLLHSFYFFWINRERKRVIKFVYFFPSLLFSLLKLVGVQHARKICSQPLPSNSVFFRHLTYEKLRVYRIWHGISNQIKLETKWQRDTKWVCAMRLTFDFTFLCVCQQINQYIQKKEIIFFIVKRKALYSYFSRKWVTCFNVTESVGLLGWWNVLHFRVHYWKNIIILVSSWNKKRETLFIIMLAPFDDPANKPVKSKIYSLDAKFGHRFGIILTVEYECIQRAQRHKTDVNCIRAAWLFIGHINKISKNA